MRARCWIVPCLALALGGCVDLTRPPELLLRSDGARPALPDGSAPPDGSGPRQADRPVLTDDGGLPVRIALGKPCNTAAACQSGFCVDGICCNSLCASLCHTCALTGSEGSCLPAPAAQDPRNECATDPPGTCARDGTCDGKGACRNYPAGSECVSGTCVGHIEYAARLCDGQGVCAAGSNRACAAGASCMGTSCASSCTSDANCQTGFFCDAGTCKVKRPAGAACTQALQCATGFCADGVCCGTACTQTCYACNLAGVAGTCVAIADGQDPGNDCAADAASTCGRTGACNGAGACRLHPAGTACAATSCTGSTESAAGTCNGAGTCVRGAGRNCAPYLCGATTCLATCSVSSQCLAGNECMGGVCAMPLPTPPLILHWRLDETSGTRAADSSGNGLDGTCLGDDGFPTPSTTVAPTGFTNPRSRQFAMDGRQAIRLGNMPPALKPANNFTVAFWYRTTQIDISGSEPLSAGFNYYFRFRTTEVEWDKRAQKDTGPGLITCRVTVTNYSDGQWHHLAGVTSTAGMKMYFDGKEICSNTRGEDVLYDQFSDFWVGRNGSGLTYWDFDGNIDDVRIYGRALTATEVAKLAGGGQ